MCITVRKRIGFEMVELVKVRACIPGKSHVQTGIKWLSEEEGYSSLALN